MNNPSSHLLPLILNTEPRVNMRSKPVKLYQRFIDKKVQSGTGETKRSKTQRNKAILTNTTDNEFMFGYIFSGDKIINRLQGNELIKWGKTY